MKMMTKDAIRAHDDLFIICAAFRYALGRKSYAPGLVADWIEERKRLLTAELARQIAKEIHEEVASYERSRKEPLPYAARWLSLAASLEGAHPLQPEQTRNE